MARWVERGLEVSDEDRARRYVAHVGYFRLSPYTIPFQERGGTHAFRAGAQFESVLQLYIFDRRLRLLVLDALERIEVAVRAAVTDHMATKYADAHWYLSSDRFQDVGEHRELLGIVMKAVRDRLTGDEEVVEGEFMHRSALEHYLVNYGEPELPPSWLMVEGLTLGQLARLVENLKDRGDRTAVARALGITEPLLMSWLRTFVRVRNICAHHARLWNVGLGVYPALPRKPNVPWLSSPESLAPATGRNMRLYPVLVAMRSVLYEISPHSTWDGRLKELLDEFPEVPLAAMGMPEDWSMDGFWSGVPKGAWCDQRRSGASGVPYA